MFDTTNSQGAEQAPLGDLRERIGLTIPWAEPRAMVDLVERAEAAGVKQFWTNQNPNTTDALTAFAAAFQHTNTIRLGTSVVPIYPRHPLALAQQAATAAALGLGRLRLGVGTSHGPMTEGVYGLKMDHPLEYLREYVTVLRAALWAGTVDYAGRFITAQVQLSNPPRLPILIRLKAEEVAYGVCVGRAVGAGGRLLQPHRRVVQQLVDDLHRDGLDGAAFLRRKLGQAAPRTLELAEANLLGACPQRCNRGNDAAGGLPRPEALRLLGHDRLGACRSTLDRAGPDSLVEVVHVVQKRVGQVRDLGIEVARNG